MTAATVITLSTVKPKPVDWLWHGRIPAGKICLFDGDPATGKSTLTIDIAARISTGAYWPDGSANTPGDVLLMSAEDALDDTIAPRLAAAGADMNRVHALTSVPVQDKDGTTRLAPPSLPRDIPTIKRLVKRHKIKLIIIDVFMAYLSGQVDSHRDQDVRRVQHELAALAEETGSAIVLVRHLNKAAGGNALYRGGGSIGIIGAARIAFLIARDPDDIGRRIFAVTKTNLDVEPPALAYRLADDPVNQCARIEWEPEPVDLTANALLSAAGNEGDGSRSEAADWLTGLLEDGPRPAADVFREANAAGFSKDQIKRAKSRAGVRTRKLSVTGGWVWSLDEESPKSAKSAKSVGQHDPPPSRPSQRRTGSSMATEEEK